MEIGNRLVLETTLRRAVLDGDEAAWRTLYDRAFDPLWAFVHRRCRGDAARTEEVLQESFTVVVRRLRQFDPARGSFVAWVRGIALNVLRNEARRMRREQEALAAAPARPEASDPGLGEQIAMTMACLPGTYREVLRAKYEERLTVAEIAERCRKTSKAVESLLSRARSAFRNAYRRLEGERSTP